MRTRFDIFRLNIVNFDKEHVRLFLRSPLWIGVPFVAATTFAIELLIVLTISGRPFVELWQGALLCSLLGAFAWIIGIWAASGEAEDDKEEVEPLRQSISKMSVMKIENPYLRTALVCFGSLCLFALICMSQIEDIVEGVKSVAFPIAGIVLKAIAIVAVIAPVYLHEKLK